VSILVTCQCGQQFQTRDENAGRTAKCPDCGQILVVPKATSLPGDEFSLPAAPTGGYDGAETSGKAIASLVLGVCSFVCVIFTGVPAVILGCLGLSDINRSKGRLKGSGLAIAGIVTGGLGSSLIMVALLLPAVQAAREAARRSQCVNNLKQMGLAMHNYHSANDCFPAAAITDANGRPLLSWRVAILPYIEQEPLYRQFHLDEPWDSPHNITLAARMPRVYACPSDLRNTPGGATTGYQVILGPKTLFRDDNKPVGIRDVTDGTSNTLMVVEARRSVTWTKPDDATFDPTVPNSGFGGFHPGGFNALFGDGSVRFLKYSIDPQTLKALTTRDGGEVISNASL